MCACQHAVSGSERHVAVLGNVADADVADYTCPSAAHLFKSNLDFAHHVRSPLKNMVQQLCPKLLHQCVHMSHYTPHILHKGNTRDIRKSEKTQHVMNCVFCIITIHSNMHFSVLLDRVAVWPVLTS